MSFPLALGDFSTQQWPTVPLTTVAELLRGPLEGLQAMHNAGYMHRDVSPKNVLVMSFDPPQAVLCDYGKAIQADKATVTTIGPIVYLAPEVKDQESYRSPIDIWGLGVVCLWIVCPEYIKSENVKNKRPDPAWLARVLSKLSEYAKLGEHESRFANLIESMLSWNPDNRPTATQALQHRFFLSNAATGSGSDNLKHKIPHDKKPAAGSWPDNLKHKIPHDKKPAPSSGPDSSKVQPLLRADGSGDTEIISPTTS